MASTRTHADVRGIGCLLIAIAGALAAPALGWEDKVAGPSPAPTATLSKAVEPRLIELSVEPGAIPIFNARTGETYWPVSGGDENLRGACPQVVRTHSSANFTPGVQQQIALQAGLVEGEILAATYTVPQADMPIRLDLADCIFGTQNTNVQTTTQYTFLAWEGTPNNGNLIANFNTVDDFLQPVVLPPGTAAILLQVQVDPGDPEQIFIRKSDEDGNLLPHCDGTNCTFSVGFRIDEHHNPPTSCCSFCLLPAPCCPPPNNSNAFPSTDTARPSHANNRPQNWLYCLPGCTVFGIGCGDGWHRFDAMDPDLEPGGDWNIRASYTSLACQLGACCDVQEGTCEFATGSDCLAAGGNFQGDNTACDPNPCPQPVGACCGGTGGCSDSADEQECIVGGGTFNGIGSECAEVSCPTGACCTPQGCFIASSTYCLTFAQAQFQGNGTTCASINCPEFNQACCFEGNPPTCSDVIPSTCSLFTGEPQGAGSVCATTSCFPTGACCMPVGSCTDGQSPEDCAAAGGAYRGNNTVCATQSCPQPPGACCVGTNCAELLQAQCTPIPNSTWRGAFTTCPDACLPHGACCLPSGGCDENQTTAQCAASGGTYRGNDSVCAGQSCPQPTGACCNGGSCSVTTEGACGGEWQGVGSPCPGSCSTTGACCSYGQCTDVIEADCDGFVCDVADFLPPTFTGCYGDADGNGIVNAGDRGFISANIGRTEPALVCQYDLDGNGVINAGDRGFVSANIGGCAPLRDFQNGSGLNGGAPDTRFAPPTYFGAGTACSGVTCP